MAAVPEHAVTKRSSRNAAAQPQRQPLQLQRRGWCGSWALPAHAFSADTGGAKSLNTRHLQVRQGHLTSSSPLKRHVRDELLSASLQNL